MLKDVQHMLMDVQHMLRDVQHMCKDVQHMANIHQDGHSIRNIQVVSSNRVHSTHFCEANKCRIFKPFFLFIR